MKDVKEYPEVKRWLVGKSKTGTVPNYLSSLRVWCRYRGMNPTELIDEIEADRKKPRRQQGEVEHKIRVFREWLRNEKPVGTGGYDPKDKGRVGLSEKRTGVIITTLKSFYKFNGFPLINIEVKKPNTKRVNDKIPLRVEHVKKLVNHAPTLRDKAIILMLFQSGMDVSTLCSLKYGDISEELEAGKCPLLIDVTRKKTNTRYITFIGRDAIEALQAYLNKRVARNGPLSEDDPLFIKEKIVKGQPPEMNNALIQKMLKEVALISGVVSKERMEKADMNPCRPHALRAAFSSILKYQGMNNDIIEGMMGHSDPYGGAYNIQRPEELRRKYAEYEHALSIDRAAESIKQLEEKTNKEMGAILRENRNLSKQVELLEAKLAEYEQSQEQELAEQIVAALEDPRIGPKIVQALRRLEKDMG